MAEQERPQMTSQYGMLDKHGYTRAHARTDKCIILLFRDNNDMQTRLIVTFTCTARFLWLFNVTGINNT